MPTKPNRGAIQIAIIRLAPFLLPAFFFQSEFLAAISPLPLFLLTLKNHLWVSLLALFANASFLYSFGSKSALPVAVFLWSMVGIVFPLFIRVFGKIQKSYVISLLISVSIITGFIYYYSREAGMNMVDYARSQISMGMDHLLALPNSPLKPIVTEQGRDEVLRQVLTELPSGTIIALMIMFWMNLLFASQFSRDFLSKTFWSHFRTPDWLIWPTLASAALFAFTDQALYSIGLNAFKVLLVFYGFQGLSIITFLLNRYKILGFGRAIVFGLVLLIALPLVLSLGFFDLWFDFRKKFGQS